jgi:hypothetical protein
MKTSTLRQIIKEEIDSTLNENNVLKVIKHLSNNNEGIRHTNGRKGIQ